MGLIGVLFSGMCRSAAHICVHKFTKAVVVNLKQQYLHLPNLAKLRENERFNFNKYHLPGFAFGIDGVFFPFASKPRGLPPGTNPQRFFTREGADNCLLMDNINPPPGLRYFSKLFVAKNVKLSNSFVRKFNYCINAQVIGGRILIFSI